MNKLQKYQIFSAIFAIILGTLLHFTFDWSNQNTIIAAFSSINESTWEHLKLAFYPMLITTIIGSFIFPKEKNFLCSKTIGILTAICFITIFFYTYTGILGRNIALIDISSFIIAIILGEYISYDLIQSSFKCNTKISIIIIIILLLCFLFFTYNPPKIQLFQDPLTGLYGL
jgi:hypothetical protein